MITYGITDSPVEAGAPRVSTVPWYATGRNIGARSLVGRTDDAAALPPPGLRTGAGRNLILVAS